MKRTVNFSFRNENAGRKRWEGPNRFQCAGIKISTGLLYTYIKVKVSSP
jgi:hypothetical protein